MHRVVHRTVECWTGRVCVSSHCIDPLQRVDDSLAESTDDNHCHVEIVIVVVATSMSIHVAHHPFDAFVRASFATPIVSNNVATPMPDIGPQRPLHHPRLDVLQHKPSSYASTMAYPQAILVVTIECAMPMRVSVLLRLVPVHVDAIAPILRPVQRLVVQ